MEQLYIGLKKARAADRCRPGALAAHMAAARDAWATVLDRTPDRGVVLKWAGRVRAAPVLRWLHEISPLAAAEINAAKLVPVFLRACEVETVEWLRGMGGEYATTQPLLRAVINHPNAARAFATAEWIIAHAADARGPFRKSLKWAVQSGRIPLARLFVYYEDQDVWYTFYAVESGSVEMLQWANERWPINWDEAIGHFTNNSNLRVIEYILQQINEDRARTSVVQFLITAIVNGDSETARWLRESYPAICTEHAIRHPPPARYENFGELLDMVMSGSDPIPMVKWLEEVCNLRPHELTVSAKSICTGNKSLATLRECLERYADADFRKIPDLASSIIWSFHVSTRQGPTFEKLRWLLGGHPPTPEALWTEELFWSVYKLRNRLQIVRELHATTPLTVDRLSDRAIGNIYSTFDHDYIRWFYDEIGLTLNRVRAKYTEGRGKQSMLNPTYYCTAGGEEKRMQYLNLLNELGGITRDDWMDKDIEPVKSAACLGWARVLARARDDGVTAADILPQLRKFISEKSPSRMKKSLEALQNVFNISCRDLRRAALRRHQSKPIINILVADYGATIEDLRADDYAILREKVAMHASTQVLNLSRLGITPEDATAVMESLGERPALRRWRGRGWATTRRLLRKLARAR